MRATITLLYTFIVWPYLCILTMPLDTVTLHIPTVLMFIIGAIADFFLWVWVYMPGKTKTKAVGYALVSTMIFVLPVLSVSIYSYFFQHDTYSHLSTKQELEQNALVVAPGQNIQLFTGDSARSVLPYVGSAEFKVVEITPSSVTLQTTYRTLEKNITIYKSKPRYVSNDIGSGIMIQLTSIDLSSTGKYMATVSFNGWSE